MTEKKKASGYSILKGKLAKKEKEIDALRAELNVTSHDVDHLKTEIALLKKSLNLAIHNMGWFRRFIYGY